MLESLSDSCIVANGRRLLSRRWKAQVEVVGLIQRSGSRAIDIRQRYPVILVVGIDVPEIVALHPHSSGGEL